MASQGLARQTRHNHNQTMDLRNWHKLPAELQVSILSYLPSLYLRPLVRSRDPYLVDFFRKNGKNLFDVMVKSNIDRLRRRTNYAGKPFFQCFRQWFSEKGSDAPCEVGRQSNADFGSIKYVWNNNNSLNAFMYVYGKQNDLLGPEAIGELRLLGENLSRLHVTQAMMRQQRRYGHDGEDVAKAQKEKDAFCETIRRLWDFPEVAAIVSSDSLCDLIQSDPYILGEVRFTEDTRSEKRLLTRLIIPTVEMCFPSVVVDQPNIRGSVTQVELLQRHLFSISDLPMLPNGGFAYYVHGTQHEEEIGRFLARTPGNRKLRGLDRVRFLELISVM